jgi:hypothetical protein
MIGQDKRIPKKNEINKNKKKKAFLFRITHLIYGFFLVFQLVGYGLDALSWAQGSVAWQALAPVVLVSRTFERNWEGRERERERERGMSGHGEPVEPGARATRANSCDLVDSSTHRRRRRFGD